MRTSSTTVSLASQRPDRELLADAAPTSPVDGASFLRMFERRSAVTLWDKIIHTLGMPWRRHWARQQVASVLRFAQDNPATASLPAIKTLQGEFDKGGGIREQTARNATIEMMLAGAFPASAWSATLAQYLDTMHSRCAEIIDHQYQENTRDLAPDSETKMRLDAEHQKQSEGLTIFMNFVRSAPADQLRMADYSAVWAFRKAVIGPLLERSLRGRCTNARRNRFDLEEVLRSPCRSEPGEGKPANQPASVHQGRKMSDRHGAHQALCVDNADSLGVDPGIRTVSRQK